MIVELTNYVAKSVGTATSTVVTVPAGRQLALTQLSLANIVTRDVTCSASIVRSGVDCFIVRDAPIPASGSLTVAGKEQNLVLMAGDVLRVTASTASSVDVICSGVLNDLGGNATVPAPVNASLPAGNLITVNLWELGRVSTNPFLQIACPNNSGPPYTTLAARSAGSQILLLPQNITVTCTTAPLTQSFLNRVNFNDLTGAGIPGGTGVLATGTQMILL